MKMGDTYQPDKCDMYKLKLLGLLEHTHPQEISTTDSPTISL